MTRIAILFPGQGAQAVGMGSQVVAELAAARELFDRAREILGYDLSQLCREGPADQLDSTVYSQPALFVCGLSAMERLRVQDEELLRSCQATAGLSLGEYTALVFAGAMQFEDGLRVVQRRGEAMQAAADAIPGGMVSILGLELDQVQQLCDQSRQDGEVLQVANHLCPGNLVISGHRTACHRAAEAAVAAGAMKAVPLAVAGAFHTSLMQPAVEPLQAALRDLPLVPPRIPVISNVDAQPHDDPEEIRQLLVRQIVSPVQWEPSMRYLLSRQFSAFYELGPGRVLRGLLKRIDRKANCESVTV